MTAADHRAEEPVEPPVRGARESSPPALAALIRRYAYAYVCCGDFEVARQIMVKDYQLRMGPHLVDGRDLFWGVLMVNGVRTAGLVWFRARRALADGWDVLLLTGNVILTEASKHFFQERGMIGSCRRAA